MIDPPHIQVSRLYYADASCRVAAGVSPCRHLHAPVAQHLNVPELLLDVHHAELRVARLLDAHAPDGGRFEVVLRVAAVCERMRGRA